ncbi:MAG: PEGA domain-containing protein [Armatimonadota bacterium]
MAAVVQAGTEIQVQVYLKRESGRALGTQCHVYGAGRTHDAQVWIPTAAGDEGWTRRTESITVPGNFLGTGQIGEIDDNGLVSINLRDINEVPPLGALVAVSQNTRTQRANVDNAAVVLSAPAGARVFLEDTFLGVTPLLTPADMPPDSHFVFKSQGYREQTLALPPRSDTLGAFIRTALEKIPPFGTLKVSSIPEGADVFVDGEKKAVTPASLEHFPAGMHNVRIVLDGHKAYDTRVKVEPEETTRIGIELQRNAWHVPMTSEPDNAIVSVNEQEVGRTPLKQLRLPVGTVELTVQHDGYRSERRKVTVRPEAAPETLHFDLEPLPATVIVRTTPNEAMVYLDGEKIGRTPVTVKGVTPGEHHVQLMRKGYVTSHHTFTVAAGKEKECSFRLLKERGSLSVKTVPEGARVYIDGEEVGTSPIENHELVTGSHEMCIRRKGYKVWTTELEIRAQHPARVSLALIPQTTEPTETGGNGHRSDLQQVPTTPPGEMLASFDLTRSGTHRTRRMEVWVDGDPGASECKVYLRYFISLPDATNVIQAGDMVGVVLPETRWDGQVKEFNIMRGPLTKIQVGQLSRRKPAVRIELDLLSNSTVNWKHLDERTLEVQLTHQPAYEATVTDKRIALTFDDFPFSGSDLLLETLDRLGVRANFFVIGNKVRKFPETIRRASVAGHRLENHSYTGESFRDLDEKKIEEYIKLTNARIMEVVGVSPELLRAPGGCCNGDHHALVHTLGLCHCSWTVNTGDYKLRDASRIAQKIMDNARPDAIILLHDGVPETVDALEIAIPRLRARGYSFVPVQNLNRTDTVAQCVH